MKRRSWRTIAGAVVFGIIGTFLFHLTAVAFFGHLSVTVPQEIIFRGRSIVDDIGYLNLSADETYFVQLRSVTITFAGTAISHDTPPFTVTLKSLSGATAQTCTPVASSCSVTFTTTYAVSAGKTKAVKVRIDSSHFYDEANTKETLTAQINSATDILWYDGVTDNIPLEPTAVPLTIASVAYL